jgi:hypothetical protein
VHWGIGATVGSVIPTRGAIIPAAVGVDIGCGMMAVQTSLQANQLPDNLHGIRAAIEKAVPHGRTDNGRANDRGAWSDAPSHHAEEWAKMEPAYKAIVEKYPKLDHKQRVNHLGTLRMARVRISASPCAVVKMIGIRHRSPLSFAGRSSPDMPGIRISPIRHAASCRAVDERNCSAEPKQSADNPSDSIRSCSALCSDSSSSTIATSLDLRRDFIGRRLARELSAHNPIFVARTTT